MVTCCRHLCLYKGSVAVSVNDESLCHSLLLGITGKSVPLARFISKLSNIIDHINLQSSLHLGLLTVGGLETDIDNLPFPFSG